MSAGIWKKLLIAATVALLFAAYFLFDFGRFLSLDYLKRSQAEFLLLYRDHRAAVIAGYAAVYIVATALSLPGAAVLTLAGGAMFGLVTGTVVVSFASSIGATLACAVSRFLLRDWVRRSFADRLAVIDEGVRRDGLFYLFTLRLVPVFPFFVINLAMGITDMPLRSYYWVSQIGMLPATVVFVNAGKELGRIESAASILSPGLLFSFALLGIFPLLVRKLVPLLTRRRSV
ncbi:MAG: TVP38/TMEM64 family protein [Thermodesulfobacteriota bacterium]